MRNPWAIILAFIAGILIGTGIGPCTHGPGLRSRQELDIDDEEQVESESNSDGIPKSESSSEGIPDENLVTDALEFIATMERVELPENGEWATCVRVMDGDTIEIEFEDQPGATDKVRYIGVDTPETVHPERDVDPWGPEASAVNKALVENKRVWLATDMSNRDRYDRLLRYVYTEDGLFVNLALVACGLATVTTYPPDVAHVDEYIRAQEDAREAGRGLWGEQIDAEDEEGERNQEGSQAEREDDQDCEDEEDDEG